MQKSKRWIMLLAVLVMQSCMGGLYGWSVFVPVLQNQYGYSGAQCQIIFGFTIASFTIAMIFAGRLLPRMGARWVGGLGGILFGSGYGIAVLSDGSFLGLLLGIGVISGAAIGFGYVAALKSGMLWFPAHRGLVTGVAVAGFGGGAILLSQLVSYLLKNDVGLLQILAGIAFVYGGLICFSAMFLFCPPALDSIKIPQPKFKELLRDARFWVLGVGIFTGTFAGLLIVGNLKPFGLAHGVANNTAVLSISFFAMGNAIGRLTWGWLFDKIGYLSVPVKLLATAIVLPLLLMLSDYALMYLALALLVGFVFGGCFVVYAAEVSRIYGVDGVSNVYPLLFLLYGLSALLGPSFGGWLHDVTGGYGIAVVISTLLLLLGSLLTWLQRVKMIAASIA